VNAEHANTLQKGLTVQQQLWFHWLRSAERLKLLLGSVSDGPPLNEHTPYSPERLRRAEAIVLGSDMLIARMQRIERYLGYERPKSGPASALEAAKIIRRNMQRGDSDEAIALFLEKWREPSKKRGRPKGSSDSESVAVIALQLRDSNPKSWTWPKIADQLLNCKSHITHGWESDCTAKLKQSVTRLRAFLKELYSD